MPAPKNACYSNRRSSCSPLPSHNNMKPMHPIPPPPQLAHATKGIVPYRQKMMLGTSQTRRSIHQHCSSHARSWSRITQIRVLSVAQNAGRKGWGGGLIAPETKHLHKSSLKLLPPSGSRRQQQLRQLLNRENSGPFVKRAEHPTTNARTLHIENEASHSLKNQYQPGLSVAPHSDHPHTTQQQRTNLRHEIQNTCSNLENPSTKCTPGLQPWCCRASRHVFRLLRC